MTPTSIIGDLTVALDPLAYSGSSLRKGPLIVPARKTDNSIFETEGLTALVNSDEDLKFIGVSGDAFITSAGGPIVLFTRDATTVGHHVIAGQSRSLVRMLNMPVEESRVPQEVTATTRIIGGASPAIVVNATTGDRYLYFNATKIRCILRAKFNHVFGNEVMENYEVVAGAIAPVDGVTTDTIDTVRLLGRRPAVYFEDSDTLFFTSVWLSPRYLTVGSLKTTYQDEANKSANMVIIRNASAESLRAANVSISNVLSLSISLDDPLVFAVLKPEPWVPDTTPISLVLAVVAPGPGGIALAFVRVEMDDNDYDNVRWTETEAPGMFGLPQGYPLAVWYDEAVGYRVLMMTPDPATGDATISVVTPGERPWVSTGATVTLTAEAVTDGILPLNNMGPDGVFASIFNSHWSFRPADRLLDFVMPTARVYDAFDRHAIRGKLVLADSPPHSYSRIEPPPAGAAVGLVDGATDLEANASAVYSGPHLVETASTSADGMQYSYLEDPVGGAMTYDSTTGTTLTYTVTLATPVPTGHQLVPSATNTVFTDASGAPVNLSSSTVAVDSWTVDSASGNVTGFVMTIDVDPADGTPDAVSADIAGMQVAGGQRAHRLSGGRRPVGRTQ